jgi:hypothetical protein
MVDEHATSGQETDQGWTAGLEPHPIDEPTASDEPRASDEPPAIDEPAAHDELPTVEPAALEPPAPPEPEAKTEPEAEPGSETGEPREIALDLAGLHLRLGSLALARSELEMLAGRGALDAAARVDLAEVRWRTGDLVGGGEAAREALSGGGETVVALVVAAEAASALGRPSEARRLSGRALTLNEGAIDPVFRGMPRSSVWPTDPAEPVPLSATLFPPDRAEAVVDADREEASGSVQDRDAVDAAVTLAVAADAKGTPAEPGLWDVHEAAALAAGAAVLGPNDLDPSALFDDGRAALEAGDLASAAVQLGLVVRLAPALAPAVLSSIGEPLDAGLLLVQGDAYRAVGHETEARRSYAAAMGIATAPPTPAPVEHEHEGEREAPRLPAASAWWLQALAEPDPPVGVAPQAEPPTEPTMEPTEPTMGPSEVAPEPPAEPTMEPSEPTMEPTEEAPEPAWPTVPGPPIESVESPEPDREAGWRDDEGGWRVDQDEWRDDDR